MEKATTGVGNERLRAVRDRLLESGRLVNIVKKDGEETALDHCPERKPSRLYRGEDPSISHLRQESGAGPAQTAPLWGAGRESASAPCAPPLKGRRRSGAAAHPGDSDFLSFIWGRFHVAQITRAEWLERVQLHGLIAGVNGGA